MAIANTNRPQSAGANVAGKHLGLALVVIAAAQLLMVLDSTIINVALPTINKALRFSPANLEWVVTAYAVTFGGLLLFGGRTGDFYGKRRMFMVGIAVFVVSSLLGGLAQNDIWLIVTRACQGIGAAIVSPTALALIATNFPEGKPRNRALGVYAAMAGGGAAIGLLLGGILTDLVSWRWIFFVNVPVGVLIIVLAPLALSESETTANHLDVPGALTVTSGMMAFVYGLSRAASHPLGKRRYDRALAAAAMLLVSFVLIELRSVEPLMPLRIFNSRNRSGSYAVMFCIATAIFSLFFFLTQFLQNIRGWSPIQTGVAFLPVTAGIVVAAVVASAAGRSRRHPVALACRSWCRGSRTGVALADRAFEWLPGHCWADAGSLHWAGIDVLPPHPHCGLRGTVRGHRTGIRSSRRRAAGRWCAGFGRAGDRGDRCRKEQGSGSARRCAWSCGCGHGGCGHHPRICNRSRSRSRRSADRTRRLAPGHPHPSTRDPAGRRHRTQRRWGMRCPKALAGFVVEWDAPAPAPVRLRRRPRSCRPCRRGVRLRSAGSQPWSTSDH